MIEQLNNELPQCAVKLPNGREIIVALHENELAVRFYENGYEIDANDYVAFEETDNGNYRVVHMFPPITKCGLGTVALELFKDYMDATLVIQPFDSPEMSNGSRIEPDAEPFFRKMIARGIVEDNSEIDEWAES